MTIKYKLITKQTFINILCYVYNTLTMAWLIECHFRLQGPLFRLSLTYLFTNKHSRFAPSRFFPPTNIKFSRNEEGPYLFVVGNKKLLYFHQLIIKIFKMHRCLSYFQIRQKYLVNVSIYKINYFRFV